MPNWAGGDTLELKSRISLEQLLGRMSHRQLLHPQALSVEVMVWTRMSAYLALCVQIKSMC